MNYQSSGKTGKGYLCFPYKIFLLLFCVFSISCNRESGIEPLSDETNSDVIQLGASVNLQTRATNAGFELNDSIGLYLARWQDASTPGVLSGTGNYADNALFRLSALSDSWTTAQTLYYPADGSKLDFYAYYPYRAPAFGTGTTLNLSVASNQSAYAAYTRSDFMVAKTEGVQRSTSKVHLDFYHRLAQIVFVLKPGVGFTANDLRNAQVKVVNAIVDGTFDLSEKKDTVIAGTTRQDITPCGSWVESNGNQTGVMAILMPQNINTTTYIEVTVGSRKFSFKPSAATYMNPGCSREFTITVNNTGIDIETQIHPWNTCPAVSGEATEEEDDDVIVRMTTMKINPAFTVTKSGDIEVDWGDGTKEKNVFKHTYTDGKGSHEIVFRGSDKVLTTLSCSYSQLTSLEVSRNTALTSLNCVNNQLTSLEVSRNTALTTLSCSSNQLTILDISKNTALTILYCSDNKLTSLVSQNTALTTLSCSYNQLTILDVSQNTALTTLDCSSNQLTILDVSQNTALTTLDCRSNQLTSLEVSQNTALTTLSCSYNQLTILDISQNTALTILYCSDNKLTSLVSRNTALTSLNCINNQLTSLEVSQNTALTELNCNSNQLTSLEVSQNTALKVLNCGNNQLISLEVSKNTALTSLLCHFNQLTILDISKNTALTILSCVNNKLTSLVSQNTALTILSCSYNQLTILDVSQNTALTTLDCSYNQLTILDVSQNTALTTLSCSSNQLTSLEVSQNTALTILSCVYNQLTSLEVSKNTALEELNCFNNPFISAVNELTTMANGLPDLTGKNKGKLSIWNSTAQTSIQSICDAKNWKIE